MATEDEPLAAGNAATGTEREVRRTLGNLTGLFAVIGAVAAFVQIYQAFNRSGAVVKAEIHSNTSFIPEGSKLSFSADDTAIWSLVKNDGIKHYCDRTDINHKINYFKDENNCKTIREIADKIGRSAGFAEKNITRSVVDIHNSGNDVANSLKIRLPDAGHILVADQADKIVIDRDVSAGDAVVLPNLNPSEALKVTFDSSEQPFISDLERPVPAITYSRGSVSVSKYRIVSPFFGDIADLFEGIPKILLLFMFVVLSFLVTAAVIMISAVANALIKGKSIASVFQN